MKMGSRPSPGAIRASKQLQLSLQSMFNRKGTVGKLPLLELGSRDRLLQGRVLEGRQNVGRSMDESRNSHSNELVAGQGSVGGWRHNISAVAARPTKLGGERLPQVKQKLSPQMVSRGTRLDLQVVSFRVRDSSQNSVANSSRFERSVLRGKASDKTLPLNLKTSEIKFSEATENPGSSATMVPKMSVLKPSTLRHLSLLLSRAGSKPLTAPATLEVVCRQIRFGCFAWVWTNDKPSELSQPLINEGSSQVGRIVGLLVATLVQSVEVHGRLRLHIIHLDFNDEQFYPLMASDVANLLKPNNSCYSIDEISLSVPSQRVTFENTSVDQSTVAKILGDVGFRYESEQNLVLNVAMKSSPLSIQESPDYLLGLSTVTEKDVRRPLSLATCWLPSSSHAELDSNQSLEVISSYPFLVINNCIQEGHKEFEDPEVVNCVVERLPAQFLELISRAAKTLNSSHVVANLVEQSHIDAILKLSNHTSGSEEPRGEKQPNKPERSLIDVLPKQFTIQRYLNQGYFRIAVYKEQILRAANKSCFVLETTDPDLLLLITTATITASQLIPSSAGNYTAAVSIKQMLVELLRTDAKYSDIQTAPSRYIWLPKFKKHFTGHIDKLHVRELYKCFQNEPGNAPAVQPVGLCLSKMQLQYTLSLDYPTHPESLSFPYSRSDHMLSDEFSVSVVSRRMFGLLGIPLLTAEISSRDLLME